MKHAVSAVIITKNEEHNLGRCLASLGWVDEIVVVDSGSTDATMTIARSYGAKVLETPWLGFGKTKQLAVDSASNDWVLSIDADEEITETLRRGIESKLVNPGKQGYRIARRSYYLDRPIRFSGWRSDAPLRLFNRKHGRFNEKIVHESVEMASKPGLIKVHMLHYTFPSISTHLAKIDSYSALGARQLLEKGKKVNLALACLRGVVKFNKMYFLKLGFLDGKEGFVLAVISSFGVTLKYLRLWELIHKGPHDE
ncbi:glycosyl transferase [Desulfoluna limicola]|uniref:Glycosyl transferase n=1 Tax=Desulfoluna limicola TaxID=2810562 RepID=A0ABN6FBI7_9BACT|nr:glycosyltransferase family 2 protein [Desulfoluna limicola]BCS99325.1 glycosyl transferase [Desulfoluna limicola]